ncbi:DUF6262 family protein [Streptomyces sp. NPDC006510]|uniref:DUF6262 family protein n=1 Tax=Streptomyces sp. NPDC006510 TaxID=3155600 RepID=UPI0033B8E5CD
MTQLLDLPSLVLAPPESVTRQAFGRTTSVIAHAQEMLRHLRVAFDDFNGIDATQRVVWDLPALGIGSATGVRPRRHAGTADFTEIRQPWLQAVVMQWARSSNPTGGKLSTRMAACLVASRALALRPGGGMDPGVLGFADMTAVVAAFRTLLRKDGRPYSEKHRHTALSNFWQILEFGRCAGMLDTLPGLFGRHPAHRIAVPEPNEDEIGKAVPESVIAQLERLQGALGDSLSHGSMPSEEVKEMCRTLYAVMRDTGRRPNEVVTLKVLKVGCLERVDGHYNLIWDNNKGKRLRRRLPIDIESAEIIQRWERRRAALADFEHGDGYLFPAATERKDTGHLGADFPSRMLRVWVDALPQLEVLAVLHDMVARGEPVTFAAVAKTAGVSNWLVYAEGVREHIDAARARQAVHPPKPSTGASVSSAGLKTDLALARQEITALREEQDKLKDAVRRQLGQQLDQVGTGELVARIDELSRQNAEPTAERDALTRGKAEWEEKLAEAEEDRDAARASLRRMMRRKNTNPDAPEAG